MATMKRATVYLDPELHRALRVKAAETDSSISVIVNETVRRSLREDAVDLEDYRRRAKEPSRDFEGFLKDLRRRGKL
jgi:predicted transcriptional regulator